MREETNLPWRRISSNLCRYSTLKRWSITSIPEVLAEQWSPSKAYSIKGIKKTIILQWRNLIHTTWAKWSRLTLPGILAVSITSIPYIKSLKHWEWFLFLWQNPPRFSDPVLVFWGWQNKVPQTVDLSSRPLLCHSLEPGRPGWCPQSLFHRVCSFPGL